MGAAVAGVGLLLVVAVVWSATAAVLAMAALALVAAAMRAMSPRTWQLGSRSRAGDISVLVVLGLALGFLGLTTPLG
jgi:hypothetical protein